MASAHIGGPEHGMVPFVTLIGTPTVAVPRRRRPVVVALLDHVQARFFAVTAAGTVELAPVVARGSSETARSDRLELDRYLILVAEYLEELLRERPAFGLALAGHEDLTGVLRWLLPEAVAGRLIGSVELAPASTTADARAQL